MKRNPVYRRYMKAAYMIAEESNDKHTKNGAVIVDLPEEKIISIGFNLIPHGLSDVPERYERPEKYHYTEHAERTAIYTAARLGRAVDGMWMFCTWAACEDCARAIVLSGIRNVVRHVTKAHKTRSDWADSIRVGDTILEECGVNVIEYEGSVGLEAFFNGERVKV